MRVTSVVLVGMACSGGSPGAGAGTGSGSDPPPVVIDTTTTPNAFYARGIPTFIVGTAGDDAADRSLRGHAESIRALLFPQAQVVLDTSIDVAKGPAAWPQNPVLYGGAHVNALVAALQLPVRVTARKLEVRGGGIFEGDQYALVAVVPAGPDHPELVIYAGTGTPGVDGINNGAVVGRGAHPITVADHFGVVTTGSWRLDARGAVDATLGPITPRPSWRVVTPKGDAIATEIHFPEDELREEQAAIVAACRRGIARAAKAIGAGEPDRFAVDVYVHADADAKRALTGDGGYGHAVGFARTVHVVHVEAEELESLVAHEATHVLAAQAWGVAGSSLMGEGLAVWASGRYGGIALADWRPRLAASGVKRPPIRELLGTAFRKLPEAHAYPAGGLLVEWLMANLGRDVVRDQLYGATRLSWREACGRAGVTADEVEATMAF